MTAPAPVWLCIEGSKLQLLPMENHIKIYARARAYVGLVKA